MLRRLWLWLVMCVAGCASSAPPPGSAASETDRASDVRELARSQSDQARRISELEARIALLENEARRARGPTERPSSTVRIGEAAPQEEREAELALTNAQLSEAGNAGSQRRPNLRVHGKSSRRTESNADLPPVPVTNETLPVVPLPQERRNAKLAEVEAAAVSDSATSDYRAALRLLRERRFEEAGLALSKFVSDNPDHALLDRAMYWLAEVRYATRDYREALAGFENVLKRFPKSEKTPDTLYKLGMCWRRLGSEEQARSYFRRLRTEFPNSEAANLASREGST